MSTVVRPGGPAAGALAADAPTVPHTRGWLGWETRVPADFLVGSEKVGRDFCLPPSTLEFPPVINPSAIRQKGTDPATRRIIVGSFIQRLQTIYPVQREQLGDAITFHLDELRKDRKEALLRDRGHQNDSEGWVKHLPLPALIVLGHRCSKATRYQPFETPCKPLLPYEETDPSSVFTEDHITFPTRSSLGLLWEDIQSINQIIESYEGLKMPTPNHFKVKFGKEAEEVSLFMICSCTQALFKNRKTLTDVVWEDTMKSCKILVRRTGSEEKVRTLLGTNSDYWTDIHYIFTLAIPVLEAQSLAPTDPQTGTTGSFSALMALNHDTLMKDLERLIDILLIARNCVATVTKAQNLAGESLLDQQIQKLIDLCVRVTARGYDGDAGSRTEIQWGNVIGACKLTDPF